MMNSISLSLTQPRFAGGGAPTPPPIVLDRDYFYVGASSIDGDQDGTGVSIPQFLAHEADPDTVDSTEVVDALTYDIYTVTDGFVVHNWGIGGQTYSQISARFVAAFDEVGATDYCGLHIGDNGISAPNAAGITLIYDQMVVMRDELGAGNPYTMFVNTRGGYNAARTNVSETPGSYLFNLKENLFRRYEALEAGRSSDMFWTVMDHAAEYGLQDANDQHDIDQCTAPRGFMLDDGSHWNQHGYKVNVLYAEAPRTEAISGGTPWAARQFITPAAPASPAGGDTIGSAAIYGSLSGAAAADDASQAIYSVAADGVIARDGASLPARDLIKVPHVWTKTGRPTLEQPAIWVGEKAHAASAPSLVEFDGYSLISPMTSKWANALKMLCVFRLQGATGQDGVLNNILGATSQCLLRRMTGNSFDGVWRNSAGTAILSATTANNLFRVGDAARWVSMEIDVAAAVARIVHWAVPATATTVANGGSAQTALAAAPTTPVRFDVPMAFMHSAQGLSFSQLGLAIGSNRIGPFYLIPDYLDMTVQANRELFCNADGTAKVPPSDGIVGSLAEAYLIAKGRATDWRMCDFFVGGSSPNEFSFHHWKRAADADRGYLTTI